MGAPLALVTDEGDRVRTSACLGLGYEAVNHLTSSWMGLGLGGEVLSFPQPPQISKKQVDRFFNRDTSIGTAGLLYASSGFQ